MTLFMHKKRCLIACLLMLAAGMAMSKPNLAQFSASIFRIEAYETSGRRHSGTGVLVAPHTLVTNCHVIGSSQKVVAFTSAGQLAARLLRGNAQRDLCLLNVPGLQGTVVKLGGTMAKRAGDAIYAAGFAKDAGLSVNRGHIEGLFTYQGSGRIVQGSAFFGPGKSGGGLFDQNGRLIGVLTFKCRGGGPFHFAVPVEW